MVIRELIRGALIAAVFIVLLVLIAKFIRRTALRATLIVAACALIALWTFNPGRADFSHAVFEGGKPNLMITDQTVMKEILETETKYYQSPGDPHVRRENYVFFSIFDVQVSETNTYRVFSAFSKRSAF